MTTPEFEVVEDTEAERFLLVRSGEMVGYADYTTHDRSIVVPHVETLRQHRGQGFAARLLEGLLAIIRADGRTIVPLCPFAADHIRAEPAHHDLVTTR